MHHEALLHLRKSDPALARLIKKIGGCALKPDKRRSPYEALVRSVAYQQLNGRAAGIIFGRFRKLFPAGKFPAPEQVLAVPVENLRAAGFSMGKARTIRAISEAAVAGVIPTRRQASRLSDEELVERLTSIHGVGPWTVHMLLIFTLGRKDVLPVGDFGVRKGYSLAFGLQEMPSPGELQKAGEKWSPHRTVAAWYLWRACD